MSWGGPIEAIFDGVQRPLDVVWKKAGDYITKVEAVAWTGSEWEFVPRVANRRYGAGRGYTGDGAGDDPVEHRIMVPPQLLPAK